MPEQDHVNRTKNALRLIQKLKSRVAELEETISQPIAVIGIGCRFPGANGPNAFWDLLREGREAFTRVPPERWDISAYYDPDPDTPGKMWTQEGGFIADIDKFDAAFFGIAPREAQAMDPQHRLVLEVAWEALEHAGVPPLGLLGSQTGVFIGICANDYVRYLAQAGPEAIDTYFAIGNAFAAAPGRVSYLLGLHGPAVAVDTSCSSSLVALHQACTSLRRGETDLAIAGGVSLMLDPAVNINFTKARILSPDARCKTFDAAANGYVRGEGCGLVVLKRLADAQRDGERILAVVRGSAVNQDGRSGGQTVPHGPSQEAVIRQALQEADCQPQQVAYVEAHGTATPLGDPIEALALANVFRHDQSREQPLLIGSVKTNIGHLEAAAGIAGFIKVILSLYHGQIPAHLNFHEPSPYIPWSDIPLQVVTRTTPWPATRRVAGVSSFGFIGTNAHVVVEAAPPPEVPVPERQGRTWHPLILSARSRPALQAMARHYATWSEPHRDTDLADLCRAANTRRSLLEHRAALVVSSMDQARRDLLQLAQGDDAADIPYGVVRNPAKLAFLFTGQGCQYPGMTRQLYAHESIFRTVIDQCHQLFSQESGLSLLQALYDDATLLEQTLYVQPALYAVQVALAELWRSWGVVPDVVLGHSAGEYAAAQVAGILSLEDGLRLISRRARLAQDLPTEGGMAAVLAPAEWVETAIRQEPQLTIAAYNGVNNVVSGATPALQRFLARLEQEGIEYRSLAIANAFHAPFIEPMLDPFQAYAATLSFQPGHLPMICNPTGELAALDHPLDATYWRSQTRAPVRFDRCLETLRQFGCDVCLEIGPAAILANICRQVFENTANAPHAVSSLRRHEDDQRIIMQAMAELVVHGVSVDLTAGNIRHGSIPDLPTYPFQRRRFWFEVPEASRFSGTRRPSLLGERRVSAASGEIVYHTRLGRDLQPFLDDHRVFDRMVLPGATYAAMALAVAGTPASLHNVCFYEPLLIPEDQERQVQLVFLPAQQGHSRFQVFSDQGGGEAGSWRCHAEGLLATQVAPPARLALDPPLERWRAQMEVWDPADLYAAYAERGINLGESFRALDRLWVGSHQALGELCIPKSLDTLVDAMPIHPAILDACTGVIGAAMPPGQDKTLFVPFQYEHVTLYAPVPSRFFCLAIRRAPEQAEQASGETVVFDLQIIDAQSTVCGEIRGFVGKRASKAAFTGGTAVDDLLYEIGWQEVALSHRTAGAGGPVPGAWLVVSSEPTASWTGQSAVTGQKVIRVTAPPQDIAAWDALLQECQTSGLTGIVYYWDGKKGADSAAQTDPEAALQGSLDLLSLTQALVRLGMTLEQGLWLVTRGAMAWTDEVSSVSVDAATAWGFARVISAEHPELRCRRLDLDPGGSGPDMDLHWIQSALSLAHTDSELAERQGHWLVPRLRRHASRPGPPFRWQEDGTYLITGGLGALGLEVARRLAARGVRHIALIGRRDPNAHAAAVVQTLREQHCDVRVLQADVSQAAALGAALDNIRHTMPPLRGIFHVAGVLRDRTIIQLQAEDFRTVFAPKVYGTWLLDRLTADLDLDCFVLFSSAASLLGAPGQSNYAAANAYLDGFARWRRARGRSAITVNWGGWGSIGLAARDDVAHRLQSGGIAMIEPEQGIDAMERILALGSTQVVVLPVNWSVLARGAGVDGAPVLFRDLVQAVRQEAPRPVKLATRLAQTVPDAQLALLHQTLLEQVETVLRLDPQDELDPQTDFFALGMDSLTAIELRNRMRALLDEPERLSPTVVFDYPTLARLEHYLARLLNLHPPAEAPSAVMDWEAETALPSEIRVDAGLIEPLVPARAILLTGATGFLGAFLLSELLAQTEADIYCLVRAADATVAQQRLLANLAAYGLTTDKISRLFPIPADLGKPLLGLEQEMYRRLAADIDLILHNGAVVNFVYGYEQLKPVNVLGTIELLRLASSHKRKQVHYISSIAALSIEQLPLREDQLPADLDTLGTFGGVSLAAGYCRSKAVAELLVRRAAQRGIPSTIYRPGFIGGSSTNGAWSVKDIAARLFKAWVEIGGISMDQIDLAPVDYVSKAVVHLLGRSASLGKTFHLTDPQPISAAELAAVFNATCLVSVHRMPYQAFRDAVAVHAERSGDIHLAGLLEIMPAEEPANFRRPVEVDCGQTLRALAGSGVTCPRWEPGLLNAYLQYFEHHGFIKRGVPQRG